MRTDPPSEADRGPSRGGLARALRSFAYRGGTLVGSFVIGGFFGFFVIGFGLFMPAPVARPLAFLTTAHFAALGAAWTANLLAPDRTSTRIVATVAAALAAALVYSAIDLLLLLTVATEGSIAASVLGVWIFLGFAAAIATWSLRKPRSSLGRDALLTLFLVVAAVLAIVGTVLVTCTLTPCIP